MSWDSFVRKGGKQPQEPEPIDLLLSRVFSTEDGQKVLIWLRQKTKETVLAPEIPESALRAHEGKRHLVHEVETRIARAQKKDGRTYRRQLAAARGQ